MHLWGRRLCAAGFVSLALSGCAYKAEVLTTPAYDVAVSYGEKVPGLWFLFVDASELKRDLKPSDYVCSAHTFPIDLTTGFAGSVRETFGNIVAQIEVVPSPLNREEVAARGGRGMIIVRGEEVEGRLRAVPGFWSAGIDAEAEVTASITVDGRRDRLLGSTVEGDGQHQSDAGMFCEGGGKALAAAASQAVKEVVRKLAETLANSERVRKG